MTEITAKAVKDLREKTGAGMMDCKKALIEVNGNFEDAVDWLRKKGLSAASKKAGRVAAEGLIGVATAGTAGAVIEVNAETDFVGRNSQFQTFVTETAKLALKHSTIEALLQAPYNGKTVNEELTNLIATIGENMTVRRSQMLSVDKGVVVSYVHSAVVPNLGRIGVLVALESTANPESLQALGKQIAMHVAAASPQALTTTDVNAAELEREKNIFIDQAKASGRPDDIIAKMVEGRVRKYYEEIVLLEQTYVIDGKTKVSDIIKQAEKDLVNPIKITGFARFALGEGIEKSVGDFADEVAQLAK